MTQPSDSKPAATAPSSVHVQVDSELRRWLDTVRAAIQSSLASPLVVSRGDVLRLALRRLVLSYLSHLSELPNPPADLMESWDWIATTIHHDYTCPDWLVPGSSLCLLPSVQAKTPKTTKTPRKGE